MVAEKNILKRKLRAEEIADANLNKVLKDENVRMLFVKCKKLVVDIEDDKAAALTAEVKKIVKKYEPDVEVIEK